MAFSVFVDATGNLPKSMREGITVLPCEFLVDDEPHLYKGNVDGFNAHAYYEALRRGKVVHTSLVNSQLFLDRLASALERGQDVICVTMSSGISGTYNAAATAAMELMETWPDRFVHIVDSKGCGFGTGLIAVRAAELSRQGVDARDAAGILDEEVAHSCQYFTVDDLNFLKRTGRVSGVTATIATVLNIKPILYGDTEGHIVSCGKNRGRKAAIAAIVKKYEEKRIDGPEQKICISHGDCLEDAEALAELVRGITPDVPITICPHEPVSGAHVGPGMLALFFRGTER